MVPQVIQEFRAVSRRKKREVPLPGSVEPRDQNGTGRVYVGGRSPPRGPSPVGTWVQRGPDRVGPTRPRSTNPYYYESGSLDGTTSKYTLCPGLGSVRRVPEGLYMWTCRQGPDTIPRSEVGRFLLRRKESLG